MITRTIIEDLISRMHLLLGWYQRWLDDFCGSAVAIFAAGKMRGIRMGA
jgi:hypothetical protein